MELLASNLDLVIRKTQKTRTEMTGPDFNSIQFDFLVRASAYYRYHHEVKLTMSETIKDRPLFPDTFDGSTFRIAIVHSRWNKSVIDSLIAGAVSKLRESKVKKENIIIQSVPGSFELPLACQRYAIPRITHSTQPCLTIKIILVE